MTESRIGNDLFRSELLLILKKKYKCYVRLSDWVCATKTDVYQAFRLTSEECRTIVTYDRVVVLNTKTCIVNSYKLRADMRDSPETRSASLSSTVPISVDHSTQDYVGVFLEQFFLIENFSWFVRDFDNKCVTTVHVDELGYWLSQKNTVIRFWHFESRNSFLCFLQKRVLRTIHLNLLKICNLPLLATANNVCQIKTENIVLGAKENSSSNDSIPRVRIVTVGSGKNHLVEQIPLDDHFSIHLIDTHTYRNPRSLVIVLLQDLDLLKRYLSNDRIVMDFKRIVSTMDEPCLSSGDRTLSKIIHFPMISTIIFFSKIAIVDMFDRLDFATNLLETISKSMDVSTRDGVTKYAHSRFDCTTSIHEILRYIRTRFAARRRFSLLCEIASSRFSQLSDEKTTNETPRALSKTTSVVEKYGKKRKKSSARISY